MADRDNATDGARGSPLLTKREAAAFCRVSLRTFERFVQRDLPAVPIGARVFFAAQDVQRWLDQRRGTARGTRLRERPRTARPACGWPVPCLAKKTRSWRCSEGSTHERRLHPDDDPQCPLGFCCMGLRLL